MTRSAAAAAAGLTSLVTKCTLRELQQLNYRDQKAWVEVYLKVGPPTAAKPFGGGESRDNSELVFSHKP